MFTIIGKEDCPYCKKAEELLNNLGLEYRKFSTQESLILKEFINSCGLKTVPQIYYGPRYIGGFDGLEKFLESGK